MFSVGVRESNTVEGPDRFETSLNTSLKYGYLVKSCYIDLSIQQVVSEPHTVGEIANIRRLLCLREQHLYVLFTKAEQNLASLIIKQLLELT